MSYYIFLFFALLGLVGSCTVKIVLGNEHCPQSWNGIESFSTNNIPNLLYVGTSKSFSNSASPVIGLNLTDLKIVNVSLPCCQDKSAFTRFIFNTNNGMNYGLTFYNQLIEFNNNGTLGRTCGEYDITYTSEPYNCSLNCFPTPTDAMFNPVKSYLMIAAFGSGNIWSLSLDSWILTIISFPGVTDEVHGFCANPKNTSLFYLLTFTSVYIVKYDLSWSEFVTTNSKWKLWRCLVVGDFLYFTDRNSFTVLRLNTTSILSNTVSTFFGPGGSCAGNTVGTLTDLFWWNQTLLVANFDNCTIYQISDPDLIQIVQPHPAYYPTPLNIPYPQPQNIPYPQLPQSELDAPDVPSPKTHWSPENTDQISVIYKKTVYLDEIFPSKNSGDLFINESIVLLKQIFVVTGGVWLYNSTLTLNSTIIIRGNYFMDPYSVLTVYPGTYLTMNISGTAYLNGDLTTSVPVATQSRWKVIISNNLNGTFSHVTILGAEDFCSSRTVSTQYANGEVSLLFSLKNLCDETPPVWIWWTIGIVFLLFLVAIMVSCVSVYNQRQRRNKNLENIGKVIQKSQ